MADTKNFGLKGVGNDVQLGKAGSRINLSGAAIQARNAGNSAFVNVKVLTPVADEDAATKLYVDNVAAGLDPKESCAAATTANLANFTTTSGGQFTSVPATIDGVTLAEGDRVLVKNQSTQTQNGIYVVTATTTTLIRASDHNSDAEINAGNFVFVTEGTTYADTGWVLQGPDPLTMNSSNLVWVQFSGTGSYTAGTGISLNGTAFDLDFVGGGGMTDSVAIAGGDFIAFSDTTNSDTMQRRSLTNVLADLDIVTAAADGILTRTAADTYASRTITASAVAGDEGISIVNGDGVSGNPTIGLDITGLGAITTVGLTDSVVVFDGANNVEATFTDIVQDLDIPNAISANGIVTRTAADTYASRSVAASAVAGDEGISVVNGDGVSGNITIGIDIVGQTNIVTDDIDDADELLIYHSVAGGTEGVGNYAVTALKLKNYMNAGTSTSSITAGDSTLQVTDAGTGQMEFNIDGGSQQVLITAAQSTFNNNVNISTGNTLTVVDLTNNDVLIAGTGGLVEDSGGLLTFDGTTLAVTGAITVDEITIDGDTISNNTTDQPLILRPNGTGSIIFQNGSSEEILELNDTASAVNGLAITAGATGNPAQITTGTGSEANIDIGFLTNGTGVLSVTAGTGNYEDNVTADDDIPNKKYVDDAIAATGGSGTVDTVTGTVDLTSASTQNIGAATGIPANCTIMSVTLDVTAASDAVTTVTVGDATNGAASYMAATENDPETVGIYIADGRLANGGAARQATATVATAGTVGSATCIITFRHA
jgi:hypothetical protein